MKDIAITLPRKIWDKIVAGEKTIELRKRIPGDFDVAESRCYVIEKGKKAVIGRLSLEFCRMRNDGFNRALLQSRACVPCTWIEKYYEGHEYMCVWHIRSCKMYKYYIEIEALGLNASPQSYTYVW